MLVGSSLRSTHAVHMINPSVSNGISVRWFFLIKWIVANLIGWALGWMLFPSVYIALTPAFGGANQGSAFRMATGALTWAVVWGIAGVAQWVVLLRVAPRAIVWIVAGTVSGFAFGMTAENVFAAQIGTMEGLIGGVVAATCGGLILWLGLRAVFSRAFMFVPVHAIAMMAGSTIAFLFFEPILRAIHQVGGSSGAWAACGAIGGLVSGSITGAGLFWLLRHRKQILSIPR